MEAWTLSFTLILVRTAGFVAALPIFDAARAPRMVKVGLAVALASLWFGSFGVLAQPLAVAAERLSWLGFALVLGREAVLGAMLGFVFGLFLVPARIAGAYIGQEMGLSMATLADPQHPAGSNLFGQVLEALSVLIFLSLDVHHVLLTAMHATFYRWPIGGELPLGFGPAMVHGFAESQRWGLVLAAPVGACLLVTIVVLSLMAKATPQLNLFSFGLSVRLVAGLVALLVFLPDMLAAVEAWFGGLAHMVHDLLAG